MKLRQWIPRLLLGVSCLLIGQSFWIQAKAMVGQQLLSSAWQRSLNTEATHKAWPWADTWPVAEIRVLDTNQSLIVLEGVSGEAMAFGPGRISNLSNTAASGVFGIGGHRDSHLRFLEHVTKETEFVLKTLDNSESVFKVTEHYVADSQKEDLLISTNRHALVLITCYPFNALQTGGSKRYVVIAEAKRSSI